MRLVVLSLFYYCCLGALWIENVDGAAAVVIDWWKQLQSLKRRFEDIKFRRNKHHVDNVKADAFREGEEKLKDLELKVVQSQIALLSDTIDWEKLQDDYWQAVFTRDMMMMNDYEQDEQERGTRQQRRLAAGRGRKERNRAKRHKQRLDEAKAREETMEEDIHEEAHPDGGVDVDALDKELNDRVGGLLGDLLPGVTGGAHGGGYDDPPPPRPTPAEEDDTDEEDGGGGDIQFGSDGSLIWTYDPTDADVPGAGVAADVSGRFDPALGIPIPIYQYDLGNCPNPGDSPAAVPCAPDNLSRICDKYDEDNLGKFSECFEACAPSFCCIHDADPIENFIAPNCNTDVNCAQYACCYIVWWKLHDTIGQAQALRLEQSDDFFDVDADFIGGDVTNVEFFREMLFHHFDDAAEIIRLGTVQINETLSEFDSDLIFLNDTYWDTTI